MALKAHQLTVGVNHDHLRGLTRCHPALGIAELIWNALDADAKRIKVWLRESPIGGVESVEVDDDGAGIDVTRVDGAFEGLGGSWKASAKVSAQGRVMHGRAGKGRFRALGIGRTCKWYTVNRSADGLIQAFDVSIDDADLKHPYVKPAEAERSNAVAGTRVIVNNIHSPHSRAFDEESLRQRLTEEFGPFLLRYPHVRIDVQGTRLNPQALVAAEQAVNLPGLLPLGSVVSVRLVEWRKSSERRIFLCDADGTMLLELPMRSHLRDGYVSAYVSSDYFRSLQLQDMTDNQVEQLEELRPVIVAVREAVKDFVRKRLAQQSQESVRRWKEEDIYPYAGEPTDQIEAVEREVFDILAVNVDRFLPKFKVAGRSIQRMQFSLLRTALESHPEDVGEILNAVTGLPPQERKLLADLLQRTTLSNIIRATKIVDDRLHFLRGLEEMLASPDLRDQFLERDHLHELLAKNTWIFGDAYALTASDDSLTEAVRRHIEKAKLDVVVDEPILQSDGRRGRVDLMLTRGLGAPAHSREHLVIELKRPTATNGEALISQVKRYARALADDPRWADTNTKWVFWAVTYELDAYARKESTQRDRPKGLIDVGDNYVCWLRTWGALIEESRARMDYLREALEIETKKEAGVRHLTQHHGEHMPEIVESVSGSGKVKQQAVKKKKKKKTARGKSPATRRATPARTH